MKFAPDVIAGDALSTAASGMAAQRVRMNVLANNLANVRTTRDARGRFAPYLRKEVLFRAARINPNKPDEQGVLVHGIEPGRRPYVLIHEPGHPESDASGYRKVPAVSVPREMATMIEASRAYEANLSAMKLAGGALDRTTTILG